MADLVSLKDKVDLRAVVPVTAARRRYGHYIVELCPFHQDTMPSLIVYPKSFDCKACHAWGDVFAWFWHLKKLNFKEVIELIEANKLPVVTYEQQQERKIVKVDQRLPMQYHLNITADVMEYYQGKLGFTPYTVQQFQLGYGCLPGKSYPRFTIPCFEKGEVVNIQARRDDRCPQCKRFDTYLTKSKSKERGIEIHIWCPEHGKQKHPDAEPMMKYIQTLGGKQVMFNADTLWDWAEHPEQRGKVFVTEGAYKAIAICQTGCYAVSYGGSSAFRMEWSEAFLGETILIGDNDEAGKLAVEKIRSYLPHISVIYLPNEPKGDAVDFIRDNGDEAFMAEVKRQLKLPINNPLVRQVEGLYVPRL